MTERDRIPEIYILSVRATSAVAILGFVTESVCVWLQVKENIWGWRIGIANDVFYIVVILSAKLYADIRSFTSRVGNLGKRSTEAIGASMHWPRLCRPL